MKTLFNIWAAIDEHHLAEIMQGGQHLTGVVLRNTDTGSITKHLDIVNPATIPTEVINPIKQGASLASFAVPGIFLTAMVVSHCIQQKNFKRLESKIDKISNNVTKLLQGVNELRTHMFLSYREEIYHGIKEMQRDKYDSAYEFLRYGLDKIENVLREANFLLQYPGPYLQLMELYKAIIPYEYQACVFSKGNEDYLINERNDFLYQERSKYHNLHRRMCVHPKIHDIIEWYKQQQDLSQEVAIMPNDNISYDDIPMIGRGSDKKLICLEINETQKEMRIYA